jgi:hypothetical protein
MNSSFKLTEREQKILTEARRAFGNNLADYLLSGLGETQTSHRRAFTAINTSVQVEVTYRLEMTNESAQGLPIDRDLLVFAALFDMLRERQPLDSRITFRVSDILEKLGWPSNASSEVMITRAIERYLLTAYFLLDPTISMSEGGQGEHAVHESYASFRRLFIGYETTLALLPVKRTAQQGLLKVQFLPELIHDTLSEKKRFLGIDFQSLREMTEVSS